jgi:hypothetical protein
MKKLIILLLAVACLSACRKLSNPDPTFDVTTSKLTYKVGDSVRFALSGDPAILTFWPGDLGHNYLYAHRLSSPSPTSLAIATSVTSPSTGANATALHLMVTTDTLVLDSASVVKAHWTDITSRATLATGSTTVNSTVDLTDFAATGHPVTLAWHYVTVSTDIQPTWNVTAFTVTTVDPTRPLTATSSNTLTNTVVTITSTVALWYKVHVLTAPSVVSTPWTINSATLSIPSAAINTPGRNDWVVAAPIYPSRVVPDTPYGIGSIGAGTIKAVNITNPVTSFSYIYTTPGTYTATFVGSDVVAGQDAKVLTKQFTITVTP